MKKILAKIDEIINRIPPHIQDILHKGMLAFMAFMALIAIVMGIMKGTEEARPAGVQLIEENSDVFYLEQLKKENREKHRLIEDIEIDPLEFPSNRNDSVEYRQMGPDTMDHLLGEKDSMLKKEDPLRSRSDLPGLMEHDEIEPSRIERDDFMIHEKTELLSPENQINEKTSTREKKQENTGSEPGFLE